jgi:hypothetical protein
MLMDRIPPAQLNDYKNQLHEAYRYAICILPLLLLYFIMNSKINKGEICSSQGERPIIKTRYYMYRLAEPLANVAIVASIGKGRKREMNEEKLEKDGESRCSKEDASRSRVISPRVMIGFDGILRGRCRIM